MAPPGPATDNGETGVSQLTSGGGWLPRITFIISGPLVLAFTVAAVRAMRDGFGHKWVPRFWFRLAAGVVYRLMTKDVISTGPAGLLELLAFLAGFVWLTVTAIRTWQTQSAAIPTQRVTKRS
jgi:hypothetical protein